MPPVSPLAQEIVKQAYDKDFRWWFLALLVGVLLGGVIIVKYLIARAKDDATTAANMITAANKNHSDSIAAINATHSATIAGLIGELTTSREHSHQRYENLTTQYFTLTERLAGIIAGNTAESREVRNYIERSQHMEELRALQAKLLEQSNKTEKS